MKQNAKRKRGQSTAEYVIVLSLIVGAVVAMQIYIKRGLQGRIRDAVDFTDNNTTSGLHFTGNQYEPYYLASNFDTTSNTSRTENLLAGGGVDRTGINEFTNRSGSQNVTAPTAP